VRVIVTKLVVANKRGVSNRKPLDFGEAEDVRQRGGSAKGSVWFVGDGRLGGFGSP